MAGLCVYGCQHPLWGGQGLCSGQGDPIDYECVCGKGYLAVDSDGNPSCVLKSALIGTFSTMAVVRVLASGFLFWQARKQQKLPEPIKLGRRAVLRFRVIVCSRYSAKSSLYLSLVTRVQHSSHLLREVILTSLRVGRLSPPMASGRRHSVFLACTTSIVADFLCCVPDDGGRRICILPIGSYRTEHGKSRIERHSALILSRRAMECRCQNAHVFRLPSADAAINAGLQ